MQRSEVSSASWFAKKHEVTERKTIHLAISSDEEKDLREITTFPFEGTTVRDGERNIVAILVSRIKEIDQESRRRKPWLNQKEGPAYHEVPRMESARTLFYVIEGLFERKGLFLYAYAHGHI